MPSQQAARPRNRPRFAARTTIEPFSGPFDQNTRGMMAGIDGQRVCNTLSCHAQYAACHGSNRAIPYPGS